MRKLLFSLIIPFLLVGCARVNEVEELQQLEGLHEVVFHAGWEPETRTVLQGDGSVWWSPGDEISLFIDKGSDGGYKLTSTNTNVAAKVDFKGQIGSNESGSNYYALYPYNENASFDGNCFFAEIPNVQYATIGTFSQGQFVSIAKSTNDNLNFYNVCGGIKFSVANQGISKVVLQTLADPYKDEPSSAPVAGSFHIGFNQDGLPEYRNIAYSDGVQSITVYPKNSDFFEPGKYYYIAVAPFEYPELDVLYFKGETVATYRVRDRIDLGGELPKINRSRVKVLTQGDKDLPFHEYTSSCARFRLNSILPEGVDKTMITEAIFHTLSDVTTDTPIHCTLGNKDYAPVFFQMQGTVAHYYTSAACYQLEYASGLFQDWTNLERLDLSMFRTDLVTSMEMMFSGCIKLESLDLSSFNTENVKKMSGMFQLCRSLKSLDISSFSSRSLVQDLYGDGVGSIFNKCFNLTKLDLGAFDLSTCGVGNAMLHFARYSKNCAIRCSTDTKNALRSPSSMLDENDQYITWIQPEETLPTLEPIIDPNLYHSTDYSMDKKVRILNRATAGHGVNIIVLGEAYSDRVIAEGKYDRDAESAMEFLFGIEPFKSYRNLFNVILVYAVSDSESLEGTLAFDYYNAELSDPDARYESNGLLAYVTEVIVQQYENVALKELNDKKHTTIMLINDDHHAGFATIQGSFSNNDHYDYAANLEGAAFVHTHEDSFQYLVCHEFGHAFAALYEEYVDRIGTMEDWESESMKYSQTHAGWYCNVDFTSNPETIRWNRFLKDSRYDESMVSIIEGARYSNGIWKSVNQSMMNAGGEYSVPAREVIYKTIHKIAYGENWKYDYETFVLQDIKSVQPVTESSVYNVPYPIRINRKHVFKMKESTLKDGRRSISAIMN